MTKPKKTIADRLAKEPTIESHSGTVGLAHIGDGNDYRLPPAAEAALARGPKSPAAAARTHGPETIMDAAGWGEKNGWERQ